MIITDNIKDVVAVSSLLVRHYPELWAEIRQILSCHDIDIKILKNTADYWCRDYMPIQIDIGAFRRFEYEPDYLRDKPQYRTVVLSSIVPVRNREKALRSSPLRVHGGNMVMCPHDIIMTENVFADNQGISRAKCTEKLCACLELTDEENIIFVPWKCKYDIFGHTDGILRFAGIGEDGRERLLINLELYGRSYAKKVRSVL